MMFVFGEVSDAISETTQLVEDIVRSQVIEIVRKPPSPLHCPARLETWNECPLTGIFSSLRYVKEPNKPGNAPPAS